MNPVWDCARTMVKYRPEPRFAHRAALYLLKLAVFEPFRWYEGLTRAVAPTLPHPPVFILGYYRSGTTHLQEVLLTDPRFAYMNFYQGFFPTAFTVTQRAVQPVFQAILTSVGFRHPAHGIPFTFDLPCEDDIAMVASGSALAANWAQVYPTRFKEIYTRTGLMEGLTERETAAFEAELRGLLARVSDATGGRRLLLKSPPHTGRLGTLRRMFPEARFVFIHRHPLDVYASNLKLWRSFEDQHLQRIDAASVRENIVWSHDRCHAAYERDKQGLGSDRLVEVRFEDFVADPMAQVARIYDRLALGDFEALRPRFAAYLARTHQRPQAVTTLGPEERALVAARLGPWIRAWGYETPAMAAK